MLMLQQTLRVSGLSFMGDFSRSLWPILSDNVKL